MPAVTCSKFFFKHARNQKSAMEGGRCGGLGADPPTTGGNWGRGQGPQPPEAYGVGADPPSLEKFLFFWQK